MTARARSTGGNQSGHATSFDPEGPVDVGDVDGPIIDGGGCSIAFVAGGGLAFTEIPRPGESVKSP